jgi:hypothetical protein
MLAEGARLRFGHHRRAGDCLTDNTS